MVMLRGDPNRNGWQARQDPTCTVTSRAANKNPVVPSKLTQPPSSDHVRFQMVGNVKLSLNSFQV